MLRGGASAQNKETFLRECCIHAGLRHPNVVQLVGAAVLQSPWLAVLEFLQYGDLRDVLEAAQERQLTLTELENLLFCQQMATGMCYIAEQRICHRDLAARNCLVHHDNVLKIGDFGLAHRYDEGKDYYVMKESARLPMKWTAPEGVIKKCFGGKRK